jgi:uncharacterized coiled-coil protein SlyX
VAHLFDNALDETDELRRRWVPIAVVAGLAMVGSASALLWRASGSSLPALPSFTSGAAPAAAPADAPDKPVGLKDFQAFQQQIAATMQSTAQLVAAQQAEIKRLSDQVSALAARIDALQPPAASAPAAAPVPPPPPAAAAAPSRRQESRPAALRCR